MGQIDEMQGGECFDICASIYPEGCSDCVKVKGDTRKMKALAAEDRLYSVAAA